jgi:hypothetical protein
MEVGIAGALAFAASFVVLFLAPGYALMRGKRIGGDMLARAFAASSAILLCGALLLTATVGMGWLPLLAFVLLAIGATLACRSANP